MRDALWVFGYGSLLWNPGFPVAERRLARLDGWHRSFCMRSIHHRGTETEPGLVLALDAAAGAACHGVVLRAEPGSEAATLAYLRERELISSAYFETELDVVFEDASDGLTSLAYVIDPTTCSIAAACRWRIRRRSSRGRPAAWGRTTNIFSIPSSTSSSWGSRTRTCRGWRRGSGR